MKKNNNKKSMRNFNMFSYIYNIVSTSFSSRHDLHLLLLINRVKNENKIQHKHIYKNAKRSVCTMHTHNHAKRDGPVDLYSFIN